MAPLIQFWPPRSFEALANKGRNPAVDVLRGIAILLVVLFHAESLRVGFLGVDLFFVLSGFLVCGLLLRQVLNQEQLFPGKFILSRGVKIWPSYFVFLFAGMAIATQLYLPDHPEQLIPLGELPRYLLFFRNYRGGSHVSFDHIWSLCVEEHFYILLPVSLVLMLRFKFNKPRHLLFAFIAAIAAGICGKLAGWIVHFETYAATHNRIDALAWGGLLWLCFHHYGFRAGKFRVFGIAAGTLGILGCMWMFQSGGVEFFKKVILYSITPPLFALIMLCMLDLDLRWLSPFRLLGYYSYNWYLWHAFFAVYFVEKFQAGALRSAGYVIFTFLVGVVFTIIVEEPMLSRRAWILEKLIGPGEKNARSS